MTTVKINNATLAGLSSIATWFGTKTPGETIDRLTREAMDRLGMERDDEPDTVTTGVDGEAMQFDIPPNLSHTKPYAVLIDGEEMRLTHWRDIVLTMIDKLKAKGFDGERLANLGISLRRKQSAPDCWKEIDHIAKKLGIPVSVEFRWHLNPKAQYPGKTGVLRSGEA